jgi:VanZ family protein
MQKFLASANVHSLPVSYLTAEMKSTKQKRITRNKENVSSYFSLGIARFVSFSDILAVINDCV